MTLTAEQVKKLEELGFHWSDILNVWIKHFGQRGYIGYSEGFWGLTYSNIKTNQEARADLAELVKAGFEDWDNKYE